MRTVLGVDAAWTVENPSGVALAIEGPNGWRLKAVESSYERFRERAAGREPLAIPRGEAPDVSALLDACTRLGEHAPDLVAIDMPLALTPIVGRRCSDIEISHNFGAAKAATHSPSALRPGQLADKMRQDFSDRGYDLCTSDGLRSPGVLEVYPHTALIRLSGDKTRLTYKAAKTKKYWKDDTLDVRMTYLATVWRRIVDLLEKRISGVADKLTQPKMSGRPLKDFEDCLDAVVCAWVAIEALEGRARPYGDKDSAIWVPEPGLTAD